MPVITLLIQPIKIFSLCYMCYHCSPFTLEQQHKQSCFRGSLYKATQTSYKLQTTTLCHIIISLPPTTLHSYSYFPCPFPHLHSFLYVSFSELTSIQYLTLCNFIISNYVQVFLSQHRYQEEKYWFIGRTSYFFSNDANTEATSWMMNFCPMQARVPDPKGRNAAFSFGSFSTHELTPVIERSSVEPARVRYQKVRDR